MPYCLRSFGLSVLVSLMLLPAIVFSQNFNGTPSPYNSIELTKRLYHFEVYQFDANALEAYVQENLPGVEVSMQAGFHRWKLLLEPNRIVSDNYVLRAATDNGIETYPKVKDIAFKGQDLTGGGTVRLTLEKDFIYGFVEEGIQRFYIEPVWFYDKNAPRDLFVIYEKNSVNRDIDATCATLNEENYLQNLMNDHHEDDPAESWAESMSACYELELAIASDWLMYDKYGSVSGVEAHNIGVMNDVEVDYTGVFNHDIDFVIVTQFVVTTQGGDPWTSSTDAGTLLNSFTTWGNNGNFGVAFDLGQLWTDRNFNGGTVGIAWLNGICASLKYHCLQDFTGNGELLRCMTSHEIGHNFNCQHDNSGCPPDYIMCPFVSTSNTWSNQSITTVNNKLPQLISNGCLTACGPQLSASFSWSPDPGCQGQAVQFTDNSTGVITSRQWTFPGGIPATSTLANPSVTWNTPGTYNVKLSLNGGLASLTQPVTINPVPVANFTYTMSGLTATFNNTSTNGTTFEWDFGDGFASFDEDPVHTYDVAGNYTVVLTVTNDCGTSIKTITVITAPTAEFSAEPQDGCATLVVQFINESSSNSITYSWQFPGGAPAASNQPNPTVVYANSGTYPVTLTATNSSGSSTIVKQGYIVIRNIPGASFTSSTNGLTVSFNNTSQGATSYIWSFGDGDTSFVQNPVHTYDTTGTYTVILTTINDCGTNTITKTVQVEAPPVAGFVGTPTSGCAPLTVNFASTSTGVISGYQWHFPGGAPDTSSAQNPVVVYSSPGTYTVTLIVSNAAGTDTLTQTSYITVNTTPTTSFTSAVNGSTANFTNTSSGATTYSWAFGDGGSSNEANPSHTYANDGTYTVTLTATNACGSTTSTSTVVISTPPLAGFTASPTSGCAPLTVQFTNTSSTNALTFSWQFPGGNPSSSSEQNPVVVYNDSGTYSVILTVSNGAGSNTSTQTDLITVGIAPSSNFTTQVNGTVVNFTNTSNGATSYSWNFGDGGTSNQTNPSHTYASDGTYTVTLTSTNACGSATSTTTVTITTPPFAGFIAIPSAGCVPLLVQFTNTSTSNAVNINWQFPGGDPATSTAQNPSVLYTAPGSYSVTLIVSNSAGSDTLTQTNVIVAEALPTSDFSSSVNGSTASFTNGSGNAVTYFWTFGDGSSSTETNPTHTYVNDGTYTVTLIATNPCSSDTSVSNVTIATPPVAGFSANPTNGCDPLTVQFSNTSSSNAQTFAWSFPGGNPSSSTASNPVVVYTTQGSFDVTLIVGNGVGSDTMVLEDYINVGLAPISGFELAINGNSIQLTNTTNGATSYLWDFGDNTTSTETSPTHTYTEPGSYTVVLTAFNDCGSTTATQTFTIDAAPEAGFTANPTSGCGPLTVQFSGTSGTSSATYSWTFPGGEPASSSEQNPVVVYAAAGAYDVSLVVSNGSGSDMLTISNFIEVLDAPQAGFTSAVNNAVVSFSNTSSGGGSYSWDFGDNTTSNEANPTHTYANDGTYTVTLTATNDCGSATFTETVTVTTPPVSAFSADDTEGCVPFAVQFNNQSSSNSTSFAWTFEGGDPATSTETNPSVTWNQPGTYTVTLVASNSAGSSTSTQTIVVNTFPGSNFDFQTAGLSVVLSNNSVNADTYFWDFGDGETSTEANPTHTYESTGNYQVTLRAFNECGFSEFTQNVEIAGSAPLPLFSADNQTGCAPFTVQFTDESAGEPLSWKWTFEGGIPETSTDQNPTVTYNAPGTYAVTLEVSNIFGSNLVTITNYITVETVPSVGMGVTNGGNGNVSFSNFSLNADSYLWSFGDNTTSTDPEPTHTYTANGNYTVELTATNACGSASIQQSVNITDIVGTDEAAWLEYFNVYPNPNTGVFNVEMAGLAQKEVRFTLYNTLGQVIKSDVADFSLGQLRQTLRYDGIPSGVYALHIQAGEQMFRVKITVQR